MANAAEQQIKELEAQVKILKEEVTTAEGVMKSQEEEYNELKATNEALTAELEALQAKATPAKSFKPVAFKVEGKSYKFIKPKISVLIGSRFKDLSAEEAAKDAAVCAFVVENNIAHLFEEK